MKRSPWWPLAVSWGLALLALSGCVGGMGDTDGGPGASTPSSPGGQASPPIPPEPPAGSRPHTHEYYWGDEESLTLLDAEVAVILFHNHLFDEPPREQHTHGCDESLASTSQGGSVKFSLPPDEIVPPGTGELEVLVTWEDATVMGLRLLYRPANEHDFVNGGQVQSGTAYVIAVKPENADAGHSTRTHWAFFLCADSSHPVDLAQGGARVKIVAHRAPEVPLEPAHPDRWANATRLELGRLAWSGQAVSALNKGDAAWHRIPLEHGSIVPPGTETVRVRVWFNSSGPGAPVDPGTVLLYYRDSTVPEWVHKMVPVTAPSGGPLEARIRVEEGMTDGIYAHDSNWDFWVRIISRTQQAAPAGAGHWGAPHYFDGNVQALVEAVRAPP